jgi:hypothetical protein
LTEATFAVTFAKVIVFSFVFIALLTAWMVLSSHGHRNYPRDPNGSQSAPDFVVQVDDFGQFWDPEAADRALRAIEDAANETNTVVVLFVHGWHHNAAPGDENLRKFARSVQEVRATLDDNPDGQPGLYRQSRQQLTEDGRLNVLGIYVGWRGRSLPSFLDYATFWGRKAAAERVGNGDLREFIARIQSIYTARCEARRTGNTRTFMGFVSIGHSFGGQALFRAVAGRIEQELIEQTAKARRGHSGQTTEKAYVEGLGDLVILVNPALEALQFERIHTLDRQLDYASAQVPRLLVVSSKGDQARQRLFPIGRWVDTLLRPPFRGEQRALWTEALGEYGPQRTHNLKLAENYSILLPGFDPAVYMQNRDAIANLDLSNLPAIAGVKLQPTGNHRPYQPFLIAHTEQKIVKNHSQVFEQTLRRLLTDYVALLQGKRMVTKCENIAPDAKD